MITQLQVTTLPETPRQKKEVPPPPVFETIRCTVCQKNFLAASYLATSDICTGCAIGADACYDSGL